MKKYYIILTSITMLLLISNVSAFAYKAPRLISEQIADSTLILFAEVTNIQTTSLDNMNNATAIQYNATLEIKEILKNEIELDVDTKQLVAHYIYDSNLSADIDLSLSTGDKAIVFIVQVEDGTLWMVNDFNTIISKENYDKYLETITPKATPIPIENSLETEKITE